MMQPPPSQVLQQLHTSLVTAQTNNHGQLPLDDTSLSGTSGAKLLDLFAQQYQIPGFTLVTQVKIDNVNGNVLQVSGQGSYNNKTATLLLIFIDNLIEIDIEALFSTPTFDDLMVMFPHLPSDFFKDILTPGTNPVVNLPAGLPTNIAFQDASYGVKGYYFPGQGYVIAYLAPQIQGTITATSAKVSRTFYLELPTSNSGWRVLSPDTDTWTFDNLTWLLPELNISTNFPSLFSVDQVNVKLFQLYLIPNAPSFSRLYVTIANKAASEPLWSVYDNKIQLNDVTLALDLNSTSTSVTGTQTGWIQGAFALGSVLIFAEIPFPLNEGSWAILAYPNLTIEDGLDDLATLLPGGSSFSELMPAGLDTVLSAFELTYLYVAIDGSKLSLQQFTFTVSTTNPWRLVPGVLELDQLSVQMSIDAQAQITGGVQAHFEIGGNDVFVSFQRYTPKGHWYFVVNSPVIALPKLGDLAKLANGTDLSPYIQASGLNSLQFLIYNLNIGVSIGQKTALTNLGLTLKLSNNGSKTEPQLSWEVIPGVLTLNAFSVQFQLDWKPDLVADVTGFFTLNTLEFVLKFGKDKNADAFIGAYSPSGTSTGSVEIQSLIKSISPSLADLVPAGLEVELDDIFIAYINLGGKGKKFVFAMDVSVEIPLTGNPLIGDELAKDAMVNIEHLKVVVASDVLDTDEVNAINQLIQGLPLDMKVLPLPTPASGEPGSLIPKGFSIVAKLKLGNQEILINAPTAKTSQVTPSTSGLVQQPVLSVVPSEAVLLSDPVADPASNYQSTMWINIQKAFGPISLEKVGFNYHDSKVFVLLNVALNTGGLNIELLGFGIGSPLSKPAVSFEIEGLAVSFAEGPVTIAGGMLGTLEPEVDFVGALVIKAEAFNLAAFAGYDSLHGHPSFFLYALMNEPPLGGVPEFFVTGLAAGFGFNRSLVLPDVSQVYTFPFVSWTINKASAPPLDPSKPIGDQVANALQLLRDVVAPKVGEYWIAGGIEFTTYELLTSFALVTVSFGTDFEVDLLGVATLQVPPEDPVPVAEVQLELRVSFSPSSGLFAIAGQLTPNSYILSKDCRLTGGFALYFWFDKEHAGTFALSLGGYNSNFKVPDYYPSVPRLGLNWRLIPEFSITGELYFALTANVVMAGGKLSAVWQSGSIRAWFTVWADFLMIFKPFHYYIDAGIDLGVSFTVKLLFVRVSMTIHIGVNLEIWGPEFTGKARIDLSIISFTIYFGSSDQSHDSTLPWNQFVSDLLPSSSSSQNNTLLLATEAAPTVSSLVHIVINQGLIKKLNDSANAPMFLVSGESFNCTVQTVIPSKDTTFAGKVKLAGDDMQPKDQHGQVQQPNTDFGVGPAGITSKDFQPTLNIDIQTEEESQFLAVRNLANAPKALWEHKQFDSHGVPVTDPNTALSEPSVTNTLKGYVLVPYVKSPDHLLPIPKETLEYTLDDNIQHFSWSTPTYPTTDNFRNETVANTIATNSVTQVRAALLDAMLGQQLAINTQINIASLANTSDNDLMAEPQMRLLGEQKGGS